MKKLTTYLLSTGCIVAAAMGFSAIASADVTTNVSVVTGKDKDGNDVSSNSFKSLDEALKAVAKEEQDIVITLDKSYSVTAALPSKAPNVTLTTAASGVTVTSSKGLAAKGGNLTINNMTVKGSGKTKIDVKGNLELTGGAKFESIASIKGGKSESVFTISSDQFITADISGFSKIDVQSGKTLSLVGTKKIQTGELAVAGNVNIFGVPVTVDSISGSGNIYYITLSTADNKTTKASSFITIKNQVETPPTVKLGYKAGLAVKPAAPTEAEINAVKEADDIAFPAGTKVLSVGKPAEGGAAAGLSLIKKGNGEGTDGTGDGYTYDYAFSVTKKDVAVRPAVYSFSDGTTTTPIATWTEVTSAIEKAASSDANYTVTLLANTDAEKIKMPKKGTYGSLTIKSGIQGSSITSGSLAKAVKNAAENSKAYDAAFKVTVGTTDTTYIGVKSATQPTAVSTFTAKEITKTAAVFDLESETVAWADVSKQTSTVSDLTSGNSNAELKDDDTAVKYANAADGATLTGAVTTGSFTSIRKYNNNYYVLIGETYYKVKTFTAASYARSTSTAAAVDVSSGTEVTSSATGTDKLYYDGASVQSGEKVYKVSDNYYVGSTSTVQPVQYDVYAVTNGNGETATTIAATSAGTITDTDGTLTTSITDGTAAYARGLSSGWYYSEPTRAQLAFQGNLSATGNLTLQNIELFGYKAAKDSNKNIVQNPTATSISGGKFNVTLENVSLYSKTENNKTVGTTLKAVTAATLTLSGEQTVKAEKVTGTKLVIPSGETATIVTSSLQFKGDKNDSDDNKVGIKADAGSITLNIVDKKSGAVLTDAKKVKVTLEGYTNQLAELPVGTDDAEKTYEWGYNGKVVTTLGGANTGKDETNDAKIIYASQVGDNKPTISFADLKSFSTYIANEFKAGRLEGSEKWIVSLPSKPAKLELPKAGQYDTLTLAGNWEVFDASENDGKLNILDLGTQKSLKLTGNLIFDENIGIKVTKLTQGTYEYEAKIATNANKAYVVAVDAVVTAAGADVETNRTSITEALLTAVETASKNTYFDKTSETDIAGTTLKNPVAAAEALANINAAIKFYDDNKNTLDKMSSDTADSQSDDAKKVYEAYDKLEAPVKALFAKAVTKEDVDAQEAVGTEGEEGYVAAVAAHTWYKWAAKTTG